MKLVPCPDCNGMGHMTDAQIVDHWSTSREPVCVSYGCQTCQGTGEVEQDEDD